MKVYVVMGNDYPEAVFSTREKAAAFCQKKRLENQKDQTKIHWRFYEFTVDTGEAHV